MGKERERDSCKGNNNLNGPERQANNFPGCWVGKSTDFFRLSPGNAQLAARVSREISEAGPGLRANSGA